VISEPHACCEAMARSGASLARHAACLREVCRRLPKVELHQHLTGSLPGDGVREVLDKVNPALAQDAGCITAAFNHEAPERSLKAAWDLLTLQCEAVATATLQPEDLENLFASAIGELAADGVAYCELRIGLKARPTKRDYLALLSRVIRKQEEVFPETRVRLLLSVDRAKDPAQGDENIDIAIEDRLDPKSVVCGVELGGVATARHWHDFEGMFRRARAGGLPIALHCGEDRGRQSEWNDMIAFRPDRLGHCVHVNDENLARIVAAGTPVETCLTCHHRHFGVPLDQNVFHRLFPTRQVALCTDNPAFYGTTLSREYELCCLHHDLTMSELFALALRAIDFTFQTEEQKVVMRSNFEERVSAMSVALGLPSLRSNL